MLSGNPVRKLLHRGRLGSSFEWQLPNICQITEEVGAATGATAPIASFATDLTVVGGGGGGSGATTVTQTVTPSNPAANAPVTVNGTITSPPGTTPTGTITFTVSFSVRL